MDGQEEILMGSNDLAHQIVKGKRTKRQRSSSPYKAVTSSSSNGCSGGGGEGQFVSGEYNSNSGSISSPTTYSGIYDGTEEEEEEDMANCLILLAQGEGPTPKVENVSTTDRGEKRGARKFTGTVATPTVTRTGFYVYECKTCNRSFPSFQALGGHRASHKKPKATAEEKKRALLVESTNDHDAVVDDDDDDCQLNKSNLDDPICLQITSSSSSNNNNNNKGFHGKKAKKIHECSICGSEFASGQALGGHMRRHRASTANIHMSATNSSGEIKARNILQLDLNLPAPEDDHPHHEFEPSIQFASQQQALVFSAPALVDCHY